MTDYDGDLDKASSSVQTMVRTYDAAADSQCIPALDVLIEDIQNQAASGETLNQIDSAWTGYLHERHALSKLDANKHKGCVDTALALQHLAQKAKDLQLPSLTKTLQDLVTLAYMEHGMCVDAAQAASKANTAADGPHARTDDWEATMMAASSDVANVVGRAIALGFALGKLGAKFFGKR